MTPDPLLVRPLRSSEVKRAAALAADAFHEDPLFTYLYPQGRRRAWGLRIEFAAYIRRIYFREGVAEATSSTGRGIDGCALWLPPGRAASLGWREALLLPTLFHAVGWQRFRSALQAYAAFDAALPDEPFWYLGTLAVDPEAQGRGVGTALLQTGLDRADRERMPVYLETATAANVAYYKRFGFRVRGTVVLPQGPDHWAMWRDPAQRDPA